MYVWKQKYGNIYIYSRLFYNDKSQNLKLQDPSTPWSVSPHSRTHLLLWLLQTHTHAHTYHALIHKQIHTMMISKHTPYTQTNLLCSSSWSSSLLLSALPSSSKESTKQELSHRDFNFLSPKIKPAIYPNISFQSTPFLVWLINIQLIHNIFKNEDKILGRNGNIIATILLFPLYFKINGSVVLCWLIVKHKIMVTYC